MIYSTDQKFSISDIKRGYRIKFRGGFMGAVTDICENIYTEQASYYPNIVTYTLDEYNGTDDEGYEDDGAYSDKGEMKNLGSEKSFDIIGYEDHIAELTDALLEERLERRMRR